MKKGTQKKLMILGGSRYIIPVIEKAHELGCFVITCDYLADNIAHKYSDQYCDISVIDKEAVLKEAKKLNIDGIISFACDPGVTTAAYVAEKMGLPFQGPYESVKILQDKGLFRKFLEDNGFNVPNSKRYTDVDEPFSDIDYFNWPVIVKPTDSAGSKGVTKVEQPENLKKAIEVAKDNSHNGAFIIEDFLTFDGYHSSADPFTVDGKLEFVSYSDQLFDPKAENPYTPAFIIWPTTMDMKYQNELTKETQRLMDLLHMKTGIYNIESCVANGKPYLMEVSPRGGGCKIAELQRLAYGIDLIEAEIKGVLGMPIENVHQAECDGVWCEMVIHAKPDESGKLKRIIIDPEIEEKYIQVIDLTVKEGDMVLPFTGANMSLGDMFLKFNNREEMKKILEKVDDWLTIELEK